MQKRIHWIDIAKGLLILCVVIGHVKSTYSSSGLLKDSFLLNASNQFVYSFHMAAFFFISGLLAGKKGKKTNIKNIIIAYGIPYLFFSVLHWGLQIMLSAWSNHTILLTDIFKILLYPFGSLWFIYTLLIIQVMQHYIPLKHVKNIYIVSIIALAVNLYIINNFDTGVYEDTVICRVIRFYAYFATGFIFGERIELTLKKLGDSRIALVTSGVVLIIGNILTAQIKNGFLEVFSNITLACTGIIFIILVAQTTGQSKSLEYMGKQSLPIYLMHGNVLAAVRLLLTKSDIPVGGYCAAYNMHISWNYSSSNSISAIM